LHASFLYNRTQDVSIGLDPPNPESTTLDLHQQRAFVSLRDQIWLYDTLIELGVAADGEGQDFSPQGTATYILLVNGTRGNFFQRLHDHGSRLQGLFNVIAASRHWHGTHQVGIGANIAALRQATTRGEIQVLRADGTLVRQSTFTGPARPQASNTQAGVYAQDNWSPTKRLVLQAGVRTDWDRFTQSAMFEPRLSGKVLPFGDDNAKLSLGWGIYNAPLNLSVIEQSLDQHQIDIFFDPAGTVPVGGPAISQFMLPPHGLRQPRFTTSSAGWQQKIRRNTLFDIELLARNGYHSFVYVDQNPAQIGGTFLLQDMRKDRIARQPSHCATFFRKTRRSMAHIRAHARTPIRCSTLRSVRFSLADSNLPRWLGTLRTVFSPGAGRRRTCGRFNSAISSSTAPAIPIAL
jgi:hypothetical protein